MKSTELLTIEDDNLSCAWGRLLLQLVKPGISALSPITVSIVGFDDQGVAREIPAVRQAVDKFLNASGKRDTENVAWTIFPQRYLDIAGGDADLFFELFKESFERIQDFNPRNNKRGSYFQRLVDFEGEGRGPNQLAWMLDQYRNHPDSRRTSKFQASTFDPRRDHTSTGQLEFPCLQQVSFTFHEGKLHLNAFYATQQIARKGYGNYLGLCRLGVFMAREMELKFERLNVFVGLAKMDTTKSDKDLVELLSVVREHCDIDPSAKAA